MMPKLSRQRWTWSAVLLALLAMVAIQTAQAQGATVRIEIPSEGPKVGGEPFSVNVVVDDVTNLGAFEFQLTYDPSVVGLQDFKEGPFLGSSGRRVECLPPRTAEGSLHFTCVTLGATPDGPTGSGVLATLTFQPVGAGTSALHLEQVTLADPPANRLPAQAEDASVTVGQTQEGGFRWVFWGRAIEAVTEGKAATVRVKAPSGGPEVGGEPFSVSVVVDDATNLGAFEFELTYDRGVVDLQDAEEGPFLASGGRSVECLPTRKAEGSLVFTCAMLAGTPDGPSGSGVLTTLTFRPVGAGTSPLHLEQVLLADPSANRLPAQAEDASVTVGQTQEGGFRWVLWGPVIGGVGVALAAAAVVGTWWLRRRPC